MSFRSFSTLGRRCMSTAAAAKVSHEPPLKIYGVHGRYASALYTAASKANLLSQVDSEVSAFTQVISKNDGFANYLSNPTISRADKTAKVAALLEGNKISSVFKNFVVTLAGNGRLGEVDKILSTFVTLMQASKGAVVVTVTSAEALDAKTLKTVQTAVASLVGKDKPFEFKTRVSEVILGGLQVQIGDKFLDLSLASRFQQVSAEMDANGL